MDKIMIFALFGAILLLILCACCYLAGYKKGTQDMAEFHNSVWRAAEKGGTERCGRLMQMR